MSCVCARVCVCVWWSGSNLGTSAKACDGFFRDSNLVLTDEQNERHYCESIGMDTILRIFDEAENTGVQVYSGFASLFLVFSGDRFPLELGGGGAKSDM